MTQTEWVLTVLLIVVPLGTFFFGAVTATLGQQHKIYDSVEGHDFHCTIRKCGVPEHCNCGAGSGVW